MILGPALPADRASPAAYRPVAALDDDGPVRAQAPVSARLDAERLALEAAAAMHRQAALRGRLDAEQAQVREQGLRVAVHVVHREGLHRDRRRGPGSPGAS